MNKRKYELFFYNVIRDLGFFGWKLEWYDKSSEGYCWRNRRVINIGPENANIKRLMLHEIAHINTCLNTNVPHCSEFWLRFEKLLNKYLPNTLLSDSDKYIKKLYNKIDR